ncbi:hypothetical protein BDV32DRAFT_136802 [Aspergillus pseudonomiae]|nr:hypothetical protein BDV32DRAFT_136802 [Aspergillus pseudonomiae]
MRQAKRYQQLDPEARAKLKAFRSDTESSRSFVRNHGTRSAVDVCTDYLQAIYLAAREQINNLWVPDVVRKAPKRFILTIPAIWTDPAKNATKQFGSAGNHYIICDAGGGTVDLITYCVKRNEPLELVESIPGTGEACGSILLNCAFEDFLKVRLGRYYTGRRTETLEKWLRNARRRFDVEIKQQFTRSPDDRWEIYLRPQLYRARIHGTEETCLIITGRDVTRMSDPTITRVLSLISDQVTTLINRSCHCPELGIVMVGGFGQNDYLYKRVKHKFEHLATVTRPPDAWASRTLGAPCWGMNHETVTARKLPRCYGQQVYVKYNPDCGYPSSLGLKYYLSQDTEVSVDQPWEFLLVAYCDPSMDAKLTISLLAWSPSREGESPPNVRTKDGKGSYQKLDFTMQLLFGSEIVFRAEFEGGLTVLGKVVTQKDAWNVPFAAPSVAPISVPRNSSNRRSISAERHLLCQALFPVTLLH